MVLIEKNMTVFLSSFTKFNYILSCFADLKTLIDEESKKEECRRFRSTGYCPYEEICNFTHYSKVELQIFAAEGMFLTFI